MSTEERPPLVVGVHLTSCAPDDARAVFDALRRLFPASEAAGPGGLAVPGSGRAGVWSMEADLRTRGQPPRPVRLSGEVTADLYGDDLPVRQVRDALKGVCRVEDLGVVSGEHEVEARLRLVALPEGETPT